MALITVAKNVGPGDREPAIGGLQMRYRHALRAKRFHPRAVGPEPRPACAAEREHGCTGVDQALSVRSVKRKLSVSIPAAPAMAHRELHAHRVEPPQPCPQQPRGLERFRETPAAGADEGRLPQRFAPLAQGFRRKRRDRGSEVGHRLAVARKKFRQRLAVRQIERADSRPPDGIASYTMTAAPPCASTSAAISPAGPAPMMAT